MNINGVKLVFTLFFIFSCSENSNKIENKKLVVEQESISEGDKYYLENKGNSIPSKSIGNVNNGKLENGKLMPFKGSNFEYFDLWSYKNNRAYTNHKVKQTVISTYKSMEEFIPGRKFYLMECSNKNGGKIFPHKTHQNGLSVDFMMPKLKNNKPYYGLDTLGKMHYALQFDNDGVYEEDSSVVLDLNLVAKHILLLQKNAAENGLRIKKVIIKMELKDDLYATKNGKLLKASGIYLTKNLTPLINDLHDDHYHVDFLEL